VPGTKKLVPSTCQGKSPFPYADPHTYRTKYGQNGDKPKRLNPKRQQEMVVLCETFKQLFRALIVAVLNCIIFTARRYASAVYAVVVCLCVCVSHSGTKRLNIGSRKQSHMIDQGLEFSDAKDHSEVGVASKPRRMSSWCDNVLLSEQCSCWPATAGVGSGH